MGFGQSGLGDAELKLFAVFCRDASSSTLTQAEERSIWRMSPQSTLPGPTSTKFLTPSAISARTDLSHCTDPVTWRMSASRA